MTVGVTVSSSAIVTVAILDDPIATSEVSDKVTITVSSHSATPLSKTGKSIVALFVPFGISTVPERAVKSTPEVAVPLTV